MTSEKIRLITNRLSINLDPDLNSMVGLYVNEYIDDDSIIDYKTIFEKGIDLEFLEFISRLFIRVGNILEKNSTIVIGIKNTPEEMREYVSWFIKFFGYLESTELGNTYSYNSFHKEVFENKFCEYKFDTDNLKFAVEKIEIEFK